MAVKGTSVGKSEVAKAILRLKRAVVAYNKVTLLRQCKQALISVEYANGAIDSFMLPLYLVDLVANGLAPARANFWAIRVEYDGEKYELLPQHDGSAAWCVMS